jgi:hypothetical protein
MTCGAYHEAFGAAFVSGAREEVGWKDVSSFDHARTGFTLAG